MQELSLHVLDLIQNSIVAGATLIELMLEEDPAKGTLNLVLRDNGKGMSEQQAREVESPFYTTRTTRKIGLGIPLFKMACEQTGGTFSLSAKSGEGTTVSALFCTGHIDMLPLGDMDGTVEMLVFCNPQIDFLYTHQKRDALLQLDTRVLRETLGEIPLNHPEVNQWIHAYLLEQRGVF